MNRFTEPVHGNGGLDYECDPDDEKWLQQFNDQNEKTMRKAPAPLKIETLEDLLDRESAPPIIRMTLGAVLKYRCFHS